MPKVPLVVHAPRELKERLQAAAEASGMSRSRYVVGLLTEAVGGHAVVGGKRRPIKANTEGMWTTVPERPFLQPAEHGAEIDPGFGIDPDADLVRVP